MKNFKGRFDDLGVAPKIAPAADDIATVEAATEEAPEAATVALISVVTEPITAAPATEAPIEATTEAVVEELEVEKVDRVEDLVEKSDDLHIEVANKVNDVRCSCEHLGMEPPWRPGWGHSPTALKPYVL